MSSDFKFRKINILCYVYYIACALGVIFVIVSELIVRYSLNNLYEQYGSNVLHKTGIQTNEWNSIYICGSFLEFIWLLLLSFIISDHLMYRRNMLKANQNSNMIQRNVFVQGSNQLAVVGYDLNGNPVLAQRSIIIQQEQVNPVTKDQINVKTNYNNKNVNKINNNIYGFS